MPVGSQNCPAPVPDSQDREQLEYEIKGCANKAAPACLSGAQISYRFQKEGQARGLASKGCDFGSGEACALAVYLDIRAGASI